MPESPTPPERVFYCDDDSDAEEESAERKQQWLQDDQDHHQQQKSARVGYPASSKGVGTWMFCKRSRKRKYIDLSGRDWTGPEAFRQAKADKDSVHNPAHLARSELRAAMEMKRVLPEKAPSSQDSKVCELPWWGVPSGVLVEYHRHKVDRLFPWQVECLCTNNGSALDGGNLIYSAPTSGGKTLVAELLMLRRIALHKGTVLFVVPFVALAEEKVKWFRQLWSSIPLSCKVFHGDSQGMGITDDLNVAVCTIERANVLIAQLLEAGQDDALSMVVVDEVHMLCDRSRGFLLEVLLSKVRHLLGSRVQIVGMSATLPKMQDLGQWLNASLFNTTYRPVTLSVRVAKGGRVYQQKAVANTKEVDGQEQKAEMDVEVEEAKAKAAAVVAATSLASFDDVFEVCDPESPPLPSASVNETVAALCTETARQGKSVIIFCQSKIMCETVAGIVAGAMPSSAPAAMARGQSSTGGSQTCTPLPPLSTRRALVLEELRHTPVSLCPTLRATVPRGVAYHHAGLSHEERDIIQAAFADSTLTVLCATSTLAAGVNLPAHRVIIRSTSMGREQLTVEAFRQMCGRAGRLGLDVDGEAVLVVDERHAGDERGAVALVTGKQRPLMSTLNDAAGGGLEKLLLELCLIVSRRNTRAAAAAAAATVEAAMPMAAVGEGTEGQEGERGVAAAMTKPAAIGCLASELRRFVQFTLLSVQHPAATVSVWTGAALTFLLKHDFLKCVSVSVLPQPQPQPQPQAQAQAQAQAHAQARPQPLVDPLSVSSDDGQAGGKDKSKDVYTPTQLAQAAVLSGMSPLEARDTVGALERANKLLVLRGSLHLVFLVTPHSSSVTIDIPWVSLADIYSRCVRDNPETERVATEVGFDYGRANNYRFNPPLRNCTSETTRLDRRFYLALLLLSLVLEWPSSRIADTLGGGITHGQLSTFQSDASYFCSSVVSFCRELNWPHLAAALGTMSTRLSCGVREDLVPLVRLGKEMPGSRARIFCKAGLATPQALVSAGATCVAEILLASVPHVGQGGLSLAGSSSSSSAVAAAGPAVAGAEHKTLCLHMASRIVRRAMEWIKEQIDLDQDLHALLSSEV